MKYSSFEALKADTKPAKNPQKAIQRQKEFEEFIQELRKVKRKLKDENKK